MRTYDQFDEPVTYPVLRAVDVYVGGVLHRTVFGEEWRGLHEQLDAITAENTASGEPSKMKFKVLTGGEVAERRRKALALPDEIVATGTVHGLDTPEDIALNY